VDMGGGGGGSKKAENWWTSFVHHPCGGDELGFFDGAATERKNCDETHLAVVR